MVLTPEITLVAKSKSEIIFESNSSNTGYFEIINASSEDLSAIYCQISSDKKGIKGCKTFKLFSKTAIIELNVLSSIGF
ncbi:MAG: Uncharacterised protein [Polaribacter sp. SA4-10]|nr:MAG: Uncharacterised protein [Polaribacter sp. SA4-10]